MKVPTKIPVKAATLILLVTCVASIAANAAMSGGSRADHHSVELIRQKFDAFNRHDVEAIGKTYASTATLHSPDYPSLVGNEPIADTYRKLFAAVPDAKDNLETLENSANHVYAQFVMTGHVMGAQDKPVNVRIISVYTIKDDRIVEDATYYDRKSF
jgi:ketosteroid isomerase-like protein